MKKARDAVSAHPNTENLTRNRETLYCAAHDKMEIRIEGVFTGGNPRRFND